MASNPALYLHDSHKDFDIIIYNPNSQHLVPNLKHTFKAPTVLPLTYYILAQNDLSTAVWSEKTDGMRFIIVFINKQSKEETILDAELLDNIYHIFDITYHNDKELLTTPFAERFLLAREFFNTNNLSSIKLSGKSLLCKSIFSLTPNSIHASNYPQHPFVQTPEELTHFINTYEESPETHTLIDGAIICFGLKSYKYKRSVLNTNDFLLKQYAPTRYALYAYVDRNYGTTYRKHRPLNEELKSIRANTYDKAALSKSQAPVSVIEQNALTKLRLDSKLRREREREALEESMRSQSGYAQWLGVNRDKRQRKKDTTLNFGGDYNDSVYEPRFEQLACSISQEMNDNDDTLSMDVDNECMNEVSNSSAGTDIDNIVNMMSEDDITRSVGVENKIIDGLKEFAGGKRSNNKRSDDRRDNGSKIQSNNKPSKEHRDNQSKNQSNNRRRDKHQDNRPRQQSSNADTKHPCIETNYEPMVDSHLLFVSPFFNNSFYLDFSDTLSYAEKQKYFKPELREMTKILKEMKANPASFNDVIIECSWTGSHWVPLRQRRDKFYANHYTVCTSNMSLSFEPISFNKQLYFTGKNELNNNLLSQDINPFSKEDADSFHTAGTRLRAKMLETVKAFISNENITIKSAIDLAGGRGGDLNSLLNLGAYNIFATDIDKVALCTYTNKVFDSRFVKQPFYFNAFYCNLNEDESVNEFCEEVKRRHEYKEDINCMIYNYAIHYSVQHLDNIKYIVDTFLRTPKSVFIYTYFDADEFERMSPGNKYKPRVLRTEEKNDVEVDIIQVPLPTISATGFGEEPAVRAHLLEHVVNNNVFETYEFDNIVEYIDKDGIDDDILEYFKAYRLRIVVRV